MKIVSRKFTLTSAALRPPLTGKEVGEGLFNFDPAAVTSLPESWAFKGRSYFVTIKRRFLNVFNLKLN